MTLNQESLIRNVTGIDEEDKQRILDFLQGAVYCWCKNRKDEWFSLQALVGGDNSYWERTPLIRLYEKHKKIKGDSDPKKLSDLAGVDAGWLLKSMLNEDKRSFDMNKVYKNQYQWTPKKKGKRTIEGLLRD